MKHRELLWMILPCLLLAGVGFYFSGRPSRQLASSGPSGTYRVVVDDVRMTAVTENEAARGYDTKVIIEAHEEGAPAVPANYELSLSSIWPLETDILFISQGEKQSVRDSLSQPFLETMNNSRNGMTTIIVLSKLPSIPAKYGALTLQVRIVAGREYAVLRGGKAVRPANIETSPALVSVPLRPASEPMR